MNDEQDKIDAYIDVVLALSEVLEEENQYLADFNVKESAKLLERKTKAVNIYRSTVAYLLKNPSSFENITIDEKEYTREISVRLDELLKENDLILKTRMEIGKSVMDSIVSMIKTTTVSKSTSYGSQGTFTPLEKSKNAIAINQTL